VQHFTGHRDSSTSTIFESEPSDDVDLEETPIIETPRGFSHIERRSQDSCSTIFELSDDDASIRREPSSHSIPLLLDRSQEISPLRSDLEGESYSGLDVECGTSQEDEYRGDVSNKAVRGGDSETGFSDSCDSCDSLVNRQEIRMASDHSLPRATDKGL
jgi:hypothetical protein